MFNKNSDPQAHDNINFGSEFHPDRPRNFWNSQPIPSVNGMVTAGGAEYEATFKRPAEWRNFFPRFHVSSFQRHQTPVPRVSGIRFNASITPVDIRGGYPFVSGS